MIRSVKKKQKTNKEKKKTWLVFFFLPGLHLHVSFSKISHLSLLRDLLFLHYFPSLERLP